MSVMDKVHTTPGRLALAAIIVLGGVVIVNNTIAVTDVVPDDALQGEITSGTTPSSVAGLRARPTTTPNPVILSVIVPYYNQAAILEKQLQRWAAYPVEMLSLLEFIVVDDGSPAEPAGPVLEKLKGSLGRVRVKVIQLNEDVGFNHGGACNSGALNARGNHLLFLDADHWVDLPQLERVLKEYRRTPKELRFLKCMDTLDTKYEGRWHEVTSVFTEWSGHSKAKEFRAKYMSGSPNTCVIPRMFFLEAGGYDEDLSGSWGYSDIAFQICVKHNFKVTLDHFDMKYGKGIWAWYDPGDASDFGTERDFSRNKGIHEAKSSRGQWCGTKESMARVSYHVASSLNWDLDV